MPLIVINRSKGICTFQPVGMVNPAKSKSVRASLKVPTKGDKILIVSHATAQVYFILFMWSQFSALFPFNAKISDCSIWLFKNKSKIEKWITQ